MLDVSSGNEGSDALETAHKVLVAECTTCDVNRRDECDRIGKRLGGLAARRPRWQIAVFVGLVLVAGTILGTVFSRSIHRREPQERQLITASQG